MQIQYMQCGVTDGHILIIDFHEVVSVSTRLFVEESEGVHQLVHNRALQQMKMHVRPYTKPNITCPLNAFRHVTPLVSYLSKIC